LRPEATILEIDTGVNQRQAINDAVARLAAKKLASSITLTTNADGWDWREEPA